MIIRFENLVNPSYSAEFVFNSAGFERAQYDFNDYKSFSLGQSDTDFDNKIFYNRYTNDFVLTQYHGNYWNNFDYVERYDYNENDYDIYKETFKSFNTAVFDDDLNCNCSYDSDFDNNNQRISCPDNLYSDWVGDSWTSGNFFIYNYGPLDEYYMEGGVQHHIHTDNVFEEFFNYKFDSDDDSCSYGNFLPTISFVMSSNYPKFKIFATDLNNVPVEDCRYNLFLHIITNPTNIEHLSDIVLSKTLKVGSFGVYRGSFYFENFYGNKVFNFTKPFFDFYTFFETNREFEAASRMYQSITDIPTVEINSFGNAFVFELKRDDYRGIYMSSLTCECLDNAISGLTNEFKVFNKSFSEAFNKLPVNAVDISNYGVGSVLKSNDNSDIDFYHQFTNVFTGYCGDLFGVAFSKVFLDTTTCNHSVFKTSYILDDDVGLNDSLTYILTEPFSMGRRSVFVDKNDISVFKNLCLDGLNTSFTKAFLSGDNCDKTVFRTNLGIDFGDSFSSAFNRLSGIGSVFSNTDLLNQRTFYDEFLESFKSDCNVYFSDMFAEAFNLTNCLGSVFKANDNVWNGEDTLAGIWFKQLDYDYVLNTARRSSCFNYCYSSSGAFGVSPLSYLLHNAFFDGVNSDRSRSSFNFIDGISITDVLKFSFFVNADSGSPSRSHSVFGINLGGGNDNYKILNHACDVNPNSIKFCEDVPFDFSGLPVPQVNVNNQVPVPDVDVDNNITVTPSTLDFSWDGFVNSFAVPFFRLFQSDNDSFLNVFKNAFFCQFSNNGIKRYNWENSVFKKFLYSEDSEDCGDKVGLPELDLFVAPDNIFINSDGKPTRYTVDEVFK